MEAAANEVAVHGNAVPTWRAHPLSKEGRVCVRQHIRTPVVLGLTFWGPVFSPAAFHSHWSTFLFCFEESGQSGSHLMHELASSLKCPSARFEVKWL